MIRAATPDDLDALMALESAFPGDRIPRSSFLHLLSSDHAGVFVYDADGQVLGDAVVRYRRDANGARLYSIVVHPDARGRGIGAALLETAERAALEQGCTSLRLEVREDNMPAISLYRSRGYSVVGRTADYYQDHSAALRMYKAL